MSLGANEKNHHFIMKKSICIVKNHIFPNNNIEYIHDKYNH